MNKLADEQNTRMTTAEQNGTDFYARITPGYISARHPRRTGRHDLFASAMSLIGERHGKFELVELVNALLFDIESSERRAAEADRKAREECAEICDSFAGGHKLNRAYAWECADAIRETITNGNLSENRETLAGGDLPPGGASE